MKPPFNSKKFTSSNIFKLTLGIFICTLLLIPMGMVKELIRERSRHHQNVYRGISHEWGSSQTLKGPFLEIPYSYKHYYNKEKNDSYKLIEGVATFLPEELNISGNIEPEYKKRGIYKILVYKGSLEVNGHYKSLDFKGMKTKYKNLTKDDFQWKKAQMKFYISEIKGLKNNLKINWNSKEREIEPYSGTINKSHHEGFVCDIEFDTSGINNFSFNLDLKGSKSVNFIPLGKYTKIYIKSSWHSPKFCGNYLPDNKEISNEGFEAHWNINQLNRSIKQSWLNVNEPPISKYSFGVELIEPVNKYLKTLRAAKYAILFILLTFITLFFVEIFTNQQSNPLQYILTGLALVLFYSLLVSLTEQISFNISYLISSASIISLITVYSYSIFKSIKSSFILLLLWSILYGFLFFILQLEDLALLAGNIGLFIILTVIMFTSHKLNRKSKKEENSMAIDDSYQFHKDKGDLL